MDQRTRTQLPLLPALLRAVEQQREDAGERLNAAKEASAGVLFTTGGQEFQRCRVGAAGDNAAIESFFALLQNNVLDRCVWSTRAERRITIVTRIERTFHRRRRQAALGRLTPIEYEAIMTTPASQAA